MEDLKYFKTEEEYFVQKVSLNYPSISYTEDTDEPWVQETPNYILATYRWDVGNEKDYNYEGHYIDDFYVNGRPDFIKEEKLVSINEDGSATYKLHLKENALEDGIVITEPLFYYIEEYGYGYFCVPLINIDFSNAKFKINQINQDNVYNNYICPFNFLFAPELTSLDVSNLNIEGITDMCGMFENLFELTSLDLSSFDTSNVTDISYMFWNCYSLTSLNLSSFDTSKVTGMTEMFWNCNNLTSLDLSNFDASNVTDMGDMFYGCSGLTSLYLNDMSLYDYFINNMNLTKCIVNYDYNKINSKIEGYCISNPLFYEFTHLIKVYDYNNDTYPSNLNLTLSNGIQGIYNEELNAYAFTFENVKDVVEYNILQDGVKIDTLYTYLNNTKLVIINCNYSIVNEILLITSEGNKYLLQENYDINNIINMYIDCVEVTPTITYQNNNIGRYQIIFIIDTSNVTDMSNMFYQCYYLTSLDLSSFDTSNVTDMTSMFEYCNNLSSLDLSNFDTSKVTSMSYMFYSCNKLTSLDLTHFNTSSVTNMTSMFNGCNSLTSLDLSNFDTSKVTSMSYMFYSCRSLTSLDLSNFNTSNVTTMQSMFADCNKLTSLDLSSFNTSNVTNMNYMFVNCHSLTELDLSSFDFINYTDTYNMIGNGSYQSGFILMPKLETIICKCDYIDLFYDTSINISYLSSRELNIICNGNIDIKVRLFDEGNEITEGEVLFENKQLTYDENEKYWFISLNINTNVNTSLYFNGECVGNISLNKDINYISINNIDDSLFDIILIYMYDGNIPYLGDNVTKYYINGIDIIQYTDYTLPYGETIKIQASIDIIDSMQSMFSNYNNLISVTFNENFNLSNVTNMYKMFYYCDNLTSVTFNNSSTMVNVTDMHYMFYYCKNLKIVTFGKLFKTLNATNISSMFSNCHSLTSLDLSNFDTSNVTNMTGMFEGCYNIISLDLTHFDTSKVTDMSGMFNQCYDLTSLDLSNFDTSKVTNMSYMFSWCSSLTSLDLSNFNTSNVTNMSTMFSNCSGLTSLDLSNFDTSAVTNMSNMFYYCNNLTSLNLSNFDTSNVYDMRYMFNYCNKLTSITFGNKADVSKVTSYSYMFSSVPTSCILTLCSNTQTSWDTLLSKSSVYFNGTKQYIDCTEQSLE